MRMLVLLLFAIIAGSIPASRGQATDHSLILPPRDWNAREHILYPLTVTNRADSYPLPGAWIGVEKVSVGTGRYGDDSPRLLKLDQFEFYGVDIPRPAWDRFIFTSNTGRVTDAYGYRRSLPSDNELLAVRTVAEATNLLGYIPFSDRPEDAGAGSKCFTLAPYNAIDTLEVMFSQSGGRSNITGVFVRRSHCIFQPEPDFFTNAVHRLTRAQVLDIAGKVMARRNLPRDPNRDPQVNFIAKRGCWDVFWLKNDARQGFDVTIDDQSGKVLTERDLPVEQWVELYRM